MHNLLPELYHCAACGCGAPSAARSCASSAPAGPAPRAARRSSGAATRRPAGASTACARRSRTALTMGLSGVGVWGSDIGGFFSLFDRAADARAARALGPVRRRLGRMRTEADGFALPEKPRPQVSTPTSSPTGAATRSCAPSSTPTSRAAAQPTRARGCRSCAISRSPTRAIERATGARGRVPLRPRPARGPGHRAGRPPRKLYLPRGRWVDFWRSVRYGRRTARSRLRRAAVLGGGRKVDAAGALDELPLLARAGALLPLLPPDVDTLSPYGQGGGLVHLPDRRGAAADRLPAWAQLGPFLEHGRLRSREGRGRWTLTIRDARPRIWSIQAALGSLRHPFPPLRSAHRGSPAAAQLLELPARRARPAGGRFPPRPTPNCRSPPARGR